jgi:dUTP pyrophosphatase
MIKNLLKSIKPQGAVPVKYKLLEPSAIEPMRATDGSAGFDLHCSRLEYRPGQVVCHTDVAFEIPPGFFGLLLPRSSIVRTCLRLANSAGVIDSDYRGEVSFVFDAPAVGPSPYQPCDRIGQLVVLPCPAVELSEAEELSGTVRGTGGYGSTGR